jgi:uncharacterized repeat protein (TIGR01451 family)
LIRRGHISARAGGSRIGILLFTLALLLGAAFPAQADDCSDYPGGVIDGFAGTIPPSQLQIDQNCTIRNFPASSPLTTNFSFLTQPGQTDERWLIVFDNVVHTGQMACNSVAGHKIWFTNGSSSSIQEGCQNLLIPVEKIDKQNPAGQTTAAIGVPFTYTLTMPVLFDPATGEVINASGSLNDLHGVTVWDDLNATGVDLTYLGHVAYWRNSGAPVPHTFSNVGGALTFDNFPIIPAGQQIELEITVVLDDTPTNATGTQFVNTAKWDFGRLIDGVYYEPLPGEWGITPPLTIAAPELVVTKTGPATLGLTMNLGQWGEFALDVQNTGLGDAWNVTILDQFPDGAAGGMCDLTPEVIAARVFASDGSTPIPGKGWLIPGSDFSIGYSGPPSCELTLTMLTAAGAIGPNERLIITYRTRLDTDSQDGAALTNVAGAVQWFNGDSNNPDRQSYTRTLTDGSVGVQDHEDAHTVTVELYGYFFEKSVANLTSGVSPAATAAPGDTLRYTLRLQATDVPLDDLIFYDDLGALNASAVFVPGSLTLVAATIPGGADTSNTNPNGGTNGAGILDIRNLGAPANGEILIQFDIVLDPSLTDGTVVANQADLIGTVKIADSDDPNINGQADPDIDGDEDPTRVVIATIPVGPLLKENTQQTAAIGESFSYQITVPETPHPFDIYDVQISDDLTDSAADLRFLGVSKIQGSEPWTPINTGTATNLLIEDPAIGIDIPAGERIVIEIAVVLENTTANVDGLPFANTASYVYNRIDDNAASQRPGSPGTSEPMTIVEPNLVTLEKSGPIQMTIGTPETFRLDVHNDTGAPAWNLTITDQLPDGASGGTCDVPPSQFTAQVFEENGTDPVSAQLVEGMDFSVTFSGEPECLFSVVILTAAGTIDADQRLIVTYEAQLDADTQNGIALTNVAAATQWFSADGSSPGTPSERRIYTRERTDGTVNELDHQDAHTVATELPSYLFEKTVVNVTTGANPASTATPGDRLRYRLRFESLSDEPLNGLTITDELDRLNDPAVFEAGTLQLVVVPPGADTSNTDSTGGAKGTGLLEVGNLSLSGAGESLLVEFEITLAPVISNGTLVENQSRLLVNGVALADSDDPNVNGPADPFVAEDEDPTQLRIESAPAFQVEKISADLTGDSSILLAGETLRYTLTVKNVGTADAVDAVLRDDVPVNTQYVSGSTTLNGAPVPDGPSGTSPLIGGISINAPEDPTPGAMHADASATPDNVATIAFDVVIDADVIDGTVISNQGFVSAVGGGVSDQPSDDPRTPIADDPTRDVVGDSPLLFAPKSVELLFDAGAPGIVDPGDVLHYTITVYNSGNVAATGVELADSVPANTSYLDDSTTLNGLPVGDPVAGTSPLETGIPISSSDLTPPLPGAGEGTLSAGASAVIEFNLEVDADVPGGTIISNQAVVRSDELPNLLTDGDGNPATGPEPTVVVVGAGQQLSIAKQVTVVGGGAALAGSQLEYVVRVTNIAAAPAFDIVITDDLDAPTPEHLTYVDASATLDGSTTGVTVAGPVITANYSSSHGPLQPGESIVLRFRAVINASLAMGTTITNIGVVRWNTPPQTASASVSIDVGGVPGVGALNGMLWHDADFDDLAEAGERALVDWTVELYRNGQPLQSVLSDASGTYNIGGLVPNDTNGGTYELRFRAPGAGANTAALGLADSPFTNGMQQIGDIVVPSGSNLQDLNLPIDPNGVVYDAVLRAPVAGAQLTLLNAGSDAPLEPSCFEDSTQQGQVTRSDGYYKFDLNFSDSTCPSDAVYVIAVSVAGSGYTAGYSQIIPPISTSTTPLSVPTCPGSPDDAVPGTAQHCEAQPSEFAPPASVPAGTAGTNYHVHLTLDDTQIPGSSQIFNNHIPLDPVLDSAVAITKTTPSRNVSRGQLVPYEITFGNESGLELAGVSILDRIPAGFRYVEGSARIDGEPNEPTQNGLELVWDDVGMDGAERHSLLLLLAVGAGVSEGEYVNRAQAISSVTGQALSGEASATVRVVPDFTFDCTDVMGKVFDDANGDGRQDGGERGLQGIRLVTARGLIATTDQHGRFHITCAVVPREDRGSNFVLKLDDRTLPSGYRMTTRQVQVQRATRGKALRFRFGASIQRVVGLDMADAVFEPDSTEMRPQWKPRIALLIDELAKKPAILRLSYVADVEDAGLVDRRLDAIKKEISETWKELDSYQLTIETEVFWRRGAPASRSSVPLPDTGALESMLPPVGAGPPVLESEPGDAVERHLPSDEPFMRWAHDPELLDSQFGDRLEQREVVADQAKTVKLTNLVPPIRFESGVADIPPSYIAKLRSILDSMRDLENVRLNLVGHADDQPLSADLARIYGDNAGLSRERVGEVAEFIQAALALPPEAISFEWAGDSQPIATNATEEGRALNRRVEVEVWYDEFEEKVGVEEGVVSEEIKRVKICRTETVCKLRYREGHAHRARVKNLIAPLHYGEEIVGVPEEFVQQVGEALHNLREKDNVTVKFIGYTDDLPLTGRAERIYGTHLSLSKARARRVALAIQDALDLPTSSIASDGRGATRTVASNETDRGRALNRRVEVEFWYDDPLQELPDEPQPCPDAADAELVTKVYDPPWGRIAPLPIESGEAVIPAGYSQELQRAMADVADRTNVRLRFVGYTRNERLDRRTAIAYGDDIGLSAARARRTMDTIKAELELSDSQAEHEGRGYVHSDDVVNAGFLQGETSHVVVQVVYDELALLDDYEGVDVTPITRELSVKDPLALNLMRITVDGEPIDDPGRSSADVQRCTDVALERADIRFHFDDLESEPRLSVTSQPIALPVQNAGRDGGAAGTVRFRTYTNYAHFIQRSEVRIFERDQSLRAEPVAVLEVGRDGFAQWQPAAEWFASPMRELKYVLRAYDEEGHFDETAAQSLWIVHGSPVDPTRLDAGAEADASDAAPEGNERPQRDELLAGYGESGALSRNIPLGSVGSVKVHGRGIPPQHTVWLAGAPVPVDEHGDFVAEVVLPSGMHTVEVAVLDEAGNGELFLRDLEFDESDWFYVGIADLTLSGDLTDGPSDSLVGEDAPHDPDSFADGRLAFYLTGKFGEDWKLTASADTREEPVEDLFSNFLDKSPDSLFRRIDPDYHYPTFGDDGTVEEGAPTLGKFYLKLKKNESHALWGNFKVNYRDNELALVERGLYGGNLRYESLSTTDFGEERLALDGFAAEPGTVPSWEEFRGTGGSLYYTRRQDLLIGSERLRIEVRDKDSGIVTSVIHLRPTLDYDIDYFQGRILLTEPLAANVDDGLLVRSEGLSGDEAWLVVQYEYSPGFDEIDALSAGGQGHYWLNDYVKLGLTANHNADDGADSNLYAADMTLRASAESWLKLQAGRSEGLVSSSLRSDDGGYRFLGTGGLGFSEVDANAYRADVSIGVADFLAGGRGRLSLYAQRLESGYSAPGLTTLRETDQYGGTFEMPLLGKLHLAAKADKRVEEEGLETTTAEVDLGYQLTDRWSLGAGVRNDKREDNSPDVPLTQEEGTRTDAVMEVAYDSRARWRGYGFAQATLANSGSREDNNRIGLGGAYRLNDRLALDGEVSHGDLGPAVRLGTSYQQTDQTRRYLSYAYENERGYNGLHERRGSLISGATSRLSDSTSVYMEDRYQHGDSATGLARAMGINLAPTDRWSLGANWEFGTLIDNRTYAETNRNAGGARLAYGSEALQLSSGMEYLFDETEQPFGTSTERTTWLFRNNLRYQMTPSGRLVGKFNHSFSDSSLGQFFDGGYTEAVFGYAYRPVEHDRLHALAKYTYFYNVPTADEVNLQGTPAQFIQKSHVAALDLTYDLTATWSIGGKYAYRLGQVSLDRENPDFFDNNAHLLILRGDWRFRKNWEGSLEGRMLDLPDLDERRSGALLTLYRYFGDNFKVGVGYNFTDFSEDLTDLGYDHHGLFFNLVGTL